MSVYHLPRFAAEVLFFALAKKKFYSLSVQSHLSLCLRGEKTSEHEPIKVSIIRQNFHFNFFFFLAMEKEHEWTCDEPGRNRSKNHAKSHD